MQIFYQGVDITEQVQCRRCVVKDTAGMRCDSLDIEFEDAAKWMIWAPKEDDQIVVRSDGYDSGIMYVNKVLPEDGNYRIVASALPCTAREKRYASFTNKSIREIMRMCAGVSNMRYAIFGIDGDTVIPYCEQNNESCAAFLSRLLLLEGALLKCVNGKYTAIGLLYAQERDAYQTLELKSQQSRVQYKRDGATFKSITIRSPYASSTATDSLVDDTHMSMALSLPVMTNIQAGRWARNKLRSINRNCESLRIETEYAPRFTALARVDITGSTDATGEWVVETVEHDLYELKSVVTMRRNITTVF